MTRMLSGVNVALGVTGSIAAVKVVELAHELRRQGANVRGVMTESARGIVHPWAVEFATGRDVVTEITGRVEHVELCGVEGWADVLLVAPGTANTVGKIAAAVDDTPVTTCATTALGADVPVVVAPAMHRPMYDHPGVLEAIERVERWGVDFVTPRIEEGKAKIADEEAITLSVARAVGDRPLAGRHVLVTSGATSEAIDPVRVLTNRASGKTGRAVAKACYVQGADVTLVHDGDPVPYANTEQVESAAEMIEATRAVAPSADVLISAAAIGDFTVDQSDEKIRSGEELTLTLRPTRKLIDTIRGAFPDLPIVGFKTETSGDAAAMIERARETMARAGLAFVVANDASVMGAEETRTLLVHGESVAEYSGSKYGLGQQIAAALAAMFDASGGRPSDGHVAATDAASEDPGEEVTGTEGDEPVTSDPAAEDTEDADIDSREDETADEMPNEPVDHEPPEADATESPASVSDASDGDDPVPPVETADEPDGSPADADASGDADPTGPDEAEAADGPIEVEDSPDVTAAHPDVSDEDDAVGSGGLLDDGDVDDPEPRDDQEGDAGETDDVEDPGADVVDPFGGTAERDGPDDGRDDGLMDESVVDDLVDDEILGTTDTRPDDEDERDTSEPAGGSGIDLGTPAGTPGTVEDESQDATGGHGGGPGAGSGDPDDGSSGEYPVDGIVSGNTEDDESHGEPDPVPDEVDQESAETAGDDEDEEDDDEDGGVGDLLDPFS